MKSDEGDLAVKNIKYSVKYITMGSGLEVLCRKLKSLNGIEIIDKNGLDEDVWKNVDLGFIIADDVDDDELEAVLRNAGKYAKNVFTIAISDKGIMGNFLSINPSEFKNDDMYDYIINAVESIIGEVGLPGEVSLDIDDFSNLFSINHQISFTYGEAAGDKVLVEITRCVIDKNKLDLSKADYIIYSAVSGKNNIELHEIDEVIKMLKRGSNSDTNIIYGFRMDKNLGDNVKVFIWSA